MAAVSVAVVAVIAASVGVTIWRYEVALSRSAAQLDARSETVLTTTLVGLFWHEREAMREELLAPSRRPSCRKSARSRPGSRPRWGRCSAGGRAPRGPARGAGRGGQPRLPGPVHSQSGRPPARVARASAGRGRPAPGRGNEPNVLAPLMVLWNAAGPASRRRRWARSGRRRSQELAGGLAAALVAVLGCAAFAWFLRCGCCGRGRDREETLTAALRRLGGVMGRLRSTSSVLGEVTGELRLAAKNGGGGDLRAVGGDRAGGFDDRGVGRDGGGDRR